MELAITHDCVTRLARLRNDQPSVRGVSTSEGGCMKHLNLELEKLEERIATWAVPTCGGGSGSKGSGGSKSHGSGSKGSGSKSHGSGSKSGGSKSGGSKSC